MSSLFKHVHLCVFRLGVTQLECVTYKCKDEQFDCLTWNTVN